MASAARIITGIVIAGLVMIAAILIGMSLEKISPDEIGLEYDTVSKKLSSETTTEGLHRGAPGFEFIKFPSIFTTVEFEEQQCTAGDGIRIVLQISMQYKVRPDKLHELVMQFRDHDTYEQAIKLASRSAIMETCSFYNLTIFQTKRAQFQEDMRTLITERCDAFHTDVGLVQVKNIQRPESYERAVEDKEQAKEKIEVAESERDKKLVEAETAKDNAQAAALVTSQKAQTNVRIKINQAQKEAEGILFQFSREAATYKAIMTANGFTPQGLLKYLQIQALSGAEKDFYVNLKNIEL